MYRQIMLEFSSMRSSERREGLPQQREVVSHIFKIADRGPVHIEDPRHGGLHGTSLETVSYVLTSGKLPGITKKDVHEGDLNYIQGDISIFPTTALFATVLQMRDPDILIQLVRDDPNPSRKSAINYALDVAQTHGFLSELGIPLNKGEHYERARTPDQIEDLKLLIDAYAGIPTEMPKYWNGRYEDELEDVISFFTRRRKKKTEVAAASLKASERRGFLIGIDPTVQTDKSLELMKGDTEYPDIRIRTFGNGLSFRHLSGIEPLGPIEEKFLEDLRKQV